MITSNAQNKIEQFNKEGLHYNLVANAVYQKREVITDPFDEEYQRYITAALISFDMGRMMGQGGNNKYDLNAGGFASLLKNKLQNISKYLRGMMGLSLLTIDIDKEKKSIIKAYDDLAADAPKGLNQKGAKFHVGATKILHFINPNLFIIIDSNAAKAFRKFHDVKFRNTTQPGYSSERYIECLSIVQKDIIAFGHKKFKEIEEGIPLARIYDKLTFITGANLP